MNHTHRLIWNVARQAWVVAHEAASSHGQASTTRRARRAAGGLGALTLATALQVAHAASAAPAATTLPTGGQVVAGQASISQSGSAMTISQGSDRAVLNWNTFNIGSQASVTFQQPSANSVALNRVTSADPSAIYGTLRANGQVFLVNPSGVIFGAGAKVDVGGLVASSMNIGNDDFLAGRYRFTRDGASGAVINQGDINAHYVALLAPEVRNEGVITATMGTVALAGGEAVTLGLTGNRLVDITVEKATVDTLVENKRLIQAEGGTVVLSAQSANQLLGRVVNTGAIEATGISSDGGTVRLLGSSAVSHSGSIDASAGTQGQGGTVLLLAGLDNAASRTTVSGSIAARGGSEGGDGGAVETSGSHLSIADSARVDTTSAHGARGSWLLDPLDFTIAASGGDITGATLAAMLGATNVTITTNNTAATCSGVTCGSGNSSGHGDIFVNDSVSWSSAYTLTLSAWRNVVINSSITVGGTGTLALKYAQQGNSGTSGNGDYVVNAPVNLASTAHFTTTYGNDGVADNYTILTTQADLQGMQWNGSQPYALGSNVTASGNWSPIGNNISAYEGLFAGLGHTVSGISITSGDYVGMFGFVGAAGYVRDIGVVNANINGTQYVGAVAGYNMGTVFHAYSTGSVMGFTSSTPILAIGGLVGANEGVVERSYSTATVNALNDTSFNTYFGGGTDGAVGGLVGRNTNGTVMDSYAAGAVSGLRDVGGLVGYVDGNSTITNTYASGAVLGATNAGGLTGAVMMTLTGSNNFWDTQTTGQAITADNISTGKTTAQMKTAATFTGAGWDTTVWTIAGGSYPVLTFWPAAASLQAITISLNNSSRTYGDTAAPTLSGWSITSGSLLSGDALTSVSFGSALTNYLGAGTYYYDTTANLLTANLTFANGHSLSDYSITWVHNSLTVNPKTVTITPDANQTKVYNGQAGADPALTYASYASQLVNGDTVNATGALARAGGNDVGSYAIGLGGLASGNANYVFALNNTPVNFSITPKALSISAPTVAASKVYDGTESISLTSLGTLSGLEGGETLTVSGTGRLNGIDAGNRTAILATYTLADDNSSGGKASNYSLASQTLNQTVTVSPKSVVLTAPSITKTWDGGTSYRLEPPDLSSLSAGVTGDSVTWINLRYDSPDIGKNIRVFASGATIQRGGQDVTSNYFIDYQSSLGGTITQLLGINSGQLLELLRANELSKQAQNQPGVMIAEAAVETLDNFNNYFANSKNADDILRALETIRAAVCPNTCTAYSLADAEALVPSRVSSSYNKRALISSLTLNGGIGIDSFRVDLAKVRKLSTKLRRISILIAADV